MKTLHDLLNSRGFQMFQESRLGNDLFINDPERANRIWDAAEEGIDGSTHSEHIQDCRDFLSDADISDEDKEAIEKEIDACEAWHAENGSLEQAGV